MKIAPETASQRKTRHLDICSHPERYPIESDDNGFGRWRLNHRALPELAWDELDTGVDFLGRRLTLPLFISCMTGGAPGSVELNRQLAEAAEQLGIAVGTGSIRLLLRHPEYLPDFCLKRWAPSVPLLANIGATAIRDLSAAAIQVWLDAMAADALVIHLNAGQELFQPSGDRDFRGLSAAIAGYIKQATLPVIVKETGFGLAPDEADGLLNAGADYVDVAGAGGANWALVESFRQGGDLALAEELRNWGYPTAEILAALGHRDGRVLASGGLRSALDCAKALALGAQACGLATPLARVAEAGGQAAVVEHLSALGHGLKVIMLLTGSRRVADLRRPGVLQPAWPTPPDSR
jgi:isopentenyl-diphosphate delta-isomerase type 2